MEYVTRDAPGLRAAWTEIVSKRILGRDDQAKLGRVAVERLHKLLSPNQHKLERASRSKHGCKCDRSRGDYGGRCTRSPEAFLGGYGGASSHLKSWCFIDTDNSNCQELPEDEIFDAPQLADDGKLKKTLKWTYAICEKAKCECAVRSDKDSCSKETKDPRKFVDDGKHQGSVYAATCRLPHDHTCPVYDKRTDEAGTEYDVSFWPCNRFQLNQNAVEKEAMVYCQAFRAIFGFICFSVFLVSLPLTGAMTKFVQRRCIDTGPLARQFSGELLESDNEDAWDDMSQGSGSWR